MILKNHIILESKMVVDIKKLKTRIEKTRIQKGLTTVLNDLVQKFEPI